LTGIEVRGHRTIPTTCRAVVFHPEHRVLRCEEVRIPPLGPGELLIAVEGCNICGSDAHTVSGRRSCAGPTILGHEIVGRVVAMGVLESLPTDLAGEPISLGTRLTWSIAHWCGSCFYCRLRIPQKCVELFKYGHSTRTAAHPLSGGLAEYCVLVPGTAVLRVDDGVPLPLAATINCAMATSAGVVNARPCWDEANVLILGGGMLGLAAAAMCREAGAAAVVVSDPQPARRQLALEFGATHSCGPLVGESGEAEHVATLRRELTEGRGFDVIVDMSASAPTIERAIDWLRVGGDLILVGSVADSPPVRWDPQQLVRKMLTIRGIHNYNGDDFRAAVRFVHAQRDCYPWQKLFSQPFSLDHADAAFAAAMSGEHIRVVLQP
jgi:alcohol dehydrogenase